MDIAYYRGGSYDYLKQLGYHYLLVSFPQATFYYLVHDSFYPVHLGLLKKLGVRSLGKVTVSYQLNPVLEQKFSSAEELIRHAPIRPKKDLLNLQL